ncbi:MAG: ATP-binding protein [Candidatus Limnocylindrales bacterium]
MPFVDRQHEMQSLEERWGMTRQVALLWGRRRVGKSTLLHRFAEGKPTVFYQAVQGTETDQLAGLTDRILAYRPDPVLSAAPLANWPQAMAYLLDLARSAGREGHPLLVVLDEFPYLVVTNAAIPSLIQAALEDVKREDLPLYLILSGSQVAMFERHVLHGPLYGRRTWGEQLSPLTYRDASQFMPDWASADKLRAWAILGGIPYYLEQFDPVRSLGWNIEHRILTKGQVLYDEAELFAREELGSDASTYLSIIAAIAGGATRQAEIANRAGLAASAVPSYLATLRRLHVVTHVRPFGAPDNARSGLWRIDDGYLRFWFRFVRSNLTDLEARRAGEVFRDRVRPSLDQFVSLPAFEDACRVHVRDSLGHDPEFPARGDVGAWWGPVPDERQPGTRRTRRGEIDIVVYEGRKLVLAGEAKWHDGNVGMEALAQLDGTVRFAPGYGAQTRLAIYARDGFSDGLRTHLRMTGRTVIMRTVEDLYT